MKSVLTLAIVAALAASSTSAFADSLADTIMARPSTEASAGIHLSLGGKANTPAKPVYGASVGFRAGGQTVAQSLNAPVAKIAEFNLSGGKVQDARVGTINFAKIETTAPSGESQGFASGSTTSLLLIGGVLLALFLLFDGGSDSGY